MEPTTTPATTEKKSWLQQQIDLAKEKSEQALAAAAARKAQAQANQDAVGQIIRVYKGNHIDRDFQADAAKLAKQGYRVASQSHGAPQGPGVGKILALGVFAFAGGKKIKEMTVIYEKSAR